METTLKTSHDFRLLEPLSWKETLASLLPLWLMSIAIMAEGFPSTHIPPGLAVVAFVGSIVISIALALKHWILLEGLYIFIPLALMVQFDEISTAYKTPMIILCALILSAGILGCQRSRIRWVGWVCLLVAAAVTFAAASTATTGYWDLVSQGGFDFCYPDCLPATDQYPWWSIFFSR